MSESTPICRCRVLYLGSAVPRQSKDGLQGIQEPLRSLYPPEGAVGVKGIDSWLSVWSNGILMENVDENLQNITRFFPIESLHYCAAVRHVLIPDRSNSNSDPKFLPLDSPFAHMPRVQHPPIFSAILRRTTGIKVLECHAFICKREAAANALVRCCFHAYADNSYVQQLEVCSRKSDNCGSIYGTLTIDPTYNTEKDSSSKHLMKNNLSSRNAENLNELSNTNMDVKDGDGISDCAVFLNNSGDSNGMEGYTSVKNFYGSSGDLNATADEIETFSGANGNHKVWNGFTEEENNANIDSSHEYAVYNTTSMSRPTRPRQISAPINVQPPPFKEEGNAIIKHKKHAGAYESQSLSGTLIRAKHSPQHSTSSGLYEPTMNQVFHRQMVQRFGSKHFNFIRQNIFKGGLIKDPYQHPPCYSRFHVLMPPLNSRPMYPEYATLHSFACPKKQKKKTQNCSRSPNSTPCLSYDNLTRANPSKLKQVIGQSPVVDLKQVAIEKKELPNSLGGSLDESATQGVDSLGGTGIYRRRGHLNERAFSYSIRQEHRSRSHGSLAGLKFSPPETNKEVASEQDISQIVAALKISEHEKKKHEGL